MKKGSYKIYGACKSDAKSWELQHHTHLVICVVGKALQVTSGNYDMK
jgi:hypothetical protein